jgi:hypothetical protein
MEQAIIAVTGCIAIYLTQQSNSNLKRYACIFGLLGQPFWIHTTLVNEQWGMFALTVFYTFAWLLGVKNNWIKKKQRTIYKPGGVLHSIVWVK